MTIEPKILLRTFKVIAGGWDTAVHICATSLVGVFAYHRRVRGTWGQCDRQATFLIIVTRKFIRANRQ